MKSGGPTPLEILIQCSGNSRLKEDSHLNQQLEPGSAGGWKILVVENLDPITKQPGGCR